MGIEDAARLVERLSKKYEEEEPFLSERTRERLALYFKGDIPGTMPAEFKQLYLEELPKMMYRPGYAESHPIEALELAASLLGVGSTFAPVEGESTLGMIKGLKRGSPEARAIRRLMADEMRARKRPLGFLLKEQEEWVKENPWFGDVLRGTWYHGRRTYPERGMDFGGSRQKFTNVGEPKGISLSASPGVPQEFPGSYKTKARELIRALRGSRFASTPGEKLNVELWEKLFDTEKKLDRIRTPIGRVLPRYNRPPEEVILPTWKREDTRWAGEILKDAYKKALAQTARVLSDEFEENMEKALRFAAEHGSKPEFKEAFVYEVIKDWLKYNQRANPTFNTFFTEELRKRGFKGLLYSPERYLEYELRMFNPEEVTMLDKRRLSSAKELRKDLVIGGSIVKNPKPSTKAMIKTFMNPKKEPWKKVISKEERENASLRAWWEEIDLAKEAEKLLEELKGESWKSFSEKAKDRSVMVESYLSSASGPHALKKKLEKLVEDIVFDPTEHDLSYLAQYVYELYSSKELLDALGSEWYKVYKTFLDKKAPGFWYAE